MTWWRTIYPYSYDAACQAIWRDVGTEPWGSKARAFFNILKTAIGQLKARIRIWIYSIPIDQDNRIKIIRILVNWRHAFAITSLRLGTLPRQITGHIVIEIALLGIISNWKKTPSGNIWPKAFDKKVIQSELFDVLWTSREPFVCLPMKSLPA